MPTRNPDYRENWKALHDEHRAAAARLREQADALKGGDEETFLRREELTRELYGHEAECRRCLDTYQHPTIQDAARWVFKNFNPTGFAVKMVHDIDFEKLKTMDDVRKAWREANEAAQQAEAEVTNAMEAGKPGGRDIFTKTGNNKVFSAWQAFTAQELGVQGFSHGGGRTHVVMTVDEREGEWHVCFTPNPESTGPGVDHQIEGLATAVYRRALAQDQQAKPGAMEESAQAGGRKWLSALVNLVGGKKEPGVKPEQFHFYVHHLPRPGEHEKFYEIGMDFRDGRFVKKSDGYDRMDVIPEEVQQAYRRLTTRQASGAELPALPPASPDSEIS